MRPGKYRVARKGARPIDLGKAPFIFALSWLAMAAALIWCAVHITSNRQATLIGKSIDCAERPSFDYFAFCNGLRDGAACTLESRSRMMAFYEPIDYACAQLEPPRKFRFPTHTEPETLEMAEVSG